MEDKRAYVVQIFSPGLNLPITPRLEPDLVNCRILLTKKFSRAEREKHSGSSYTARPEAAASGQCF